MLSNGCLEENVVSQSLQFRRTNGEESRPQQQSESAVPCTMERGVRKDDLWDEVGAQFFPVCISKTACLIDFGVGKQIPIRGHACTRGVISGDPEIVPTIQRVSNS